MAKLRMALLAAVSSICLPAAGCIPATVTELPAINGRVVNSHGKPLTGATIDVVSGSTSDGPRAILTSGKDGRFHAAERVRWALVFPFIPADAIEPELTARASYRNSRSAAERFGGGLVQVRWFGIVGRIVGFCPSVDLGELVVDSETSSQRRTQLNPTKSDAAFRN